MKKFLISTAILLTLSGLTFAQSADVENLQKKATAETMIERTSGTLREAQEKAKDAKQDLKDLNLAFSHQSYAAQLFKKGEFLGAMIHTDRARELAQAVIKTNNGMIAMENEHKKESSVAPAQVDTIVVQAIPRPAGAKEEDVLSVTVKFDLN